jgi:hypothetical protein
MRRFAKTVVALALCASAWGCQQSEPGTAGASASPQVVPPVVRFRPPGDGLLTEAQLNRYVRVRRAARGRSDDEAARAVGVDPEEVAWVRARVLEALVYLDTAQVRTAAEGTYTRTIAALRESSKSVKDRETLRRLEEQIAGLERERAGLKPAEPPPGPVAANARRIAPRRAEFEPPGS